MQVMPDLVRHDLLLGMLHDKADRAGRRFRIERRKRFAVKPHSACLRTERRQLALAHTQQRRFAAAGRTAQHRKIACFQRKIHIIEHRCFAFRKRHRQMLCRKQCHVSISFPS